MQREKQAFTLDRVPTACHEGPFWGNGTMGTVLYVRENTLCLSVDHAGLWEMRETLPDAPRADFAAILKDKQAYLRGDERFAAPTDIFGSAIGRVKLPGLRIAFVLPAAVSAFASSIDLGSARGTLSIGLVDGRRLRVKLYLDSCENVLSIQLEGAGADQVQLRADGWDLSLPSLQVLKRWGYLPCEQAQAAGGVVVRQSFSGDQLAVLTLSEARQEDSLSVLATMAVGPADAAERLAPEGSALLAAYRAAQAERLAAHIADWRAYWDGCDIQVPDARLQHAYDLEMYKLYSNARQNASPVTLQGVWNPDDRMPAWYGDLHNDLNVQACYWPAFRTGNARLAQPYIDYYAAAMPRFKARAQMLFGIEGAIHVPVMMAPNGYGAASEWCYWNTLLGPELFVATDFCWFYEYTRDMEDLREKVYPFLRGVATLYRGIAVQGADGHLHIPFTQSPEYDGPDGMVMADDATFVLAALHAMLDKLARYAALLGEDGAEWQAFDKALAPVVPDDKGYPLFPGIPLAHSHRHFCHLYPIFPLGEDAHSALANRSLDTAINQGFTEFAAFSFPYLAIFAARTGRGNMCRTMLEIYCMVFRSRNSFTVNGDPYRNGVLRVATTNAGERDDSFTLESGLMLPAAMAEMMAHRAMDALWLGFGIPDEWKSCGCTGVATEGGHRVDIAWQNYALSSARILPGCDETLVVVLPIGAGEVTFAGGEAQACPMPEGTVAEKDCRAYRVSLRAGVPVDIQVR